MTGVQTCALPISHRRSEGPLPPSSPDNRRPLSERPHPSDITRILFHRRNSGQKAIENIRRNISPPRKNFPTFVRPLSDNVRTKKTRTMHRFRLILLPLCLFATATAIGQTVTGRIVDERQQPVAGVATWWACSSTPQPPTPDRKSTRLNSSHRSLSRMPSSA